MTGKRSKIDGETADRARRLQWWKDGRFGLFIHYGLYALLERGEWVMNRERIPADEIAALATRFRPKPGCAREWVKLAKQAGMKYAVLTTKHHEGFCLWDTRQTAFNAVQCGPRRDLVAEFVEACRSEGLGVGLYYSLMDWRHPDGIRCHTSERSRRRFVDFTQGCVRELMSNYGKVDVLWYDIAWPMRTPEDWESAKLNSMVRELQPDILINNRSKLPEDFGTPEGKIEAAESGRAWEACMTLNRHCIWGWMPFPAEDWYSPRHVVDMLRQVINGDGNLLLNIGPMPDGSVPPEARDCLTRVGKWIAKHEALVYSPGDSIDALEGWAGACGGWSRQGASLYYWIANWPGVSFSIGGLRNRVRDVSLLTTGKKVRFRQLGNRLILEGLPGKCPERACGIAVIKLDFARPPRQCLGDGPVLVKM